MYELIFVALTLILVFPKPLIQLPMINQSQIIDLKLGETYYLDIPDFPLQQIRDRYTSEVGEQQNYPFKYCKNTYPEISLGRMDKMTFSGVPNKPLLIYNFEDIQYSKNVLDAYSEDRKIYAFFQDGTLLVVQFSNDLKILSNHIMKAKGMDAEQRLEVGYFAKVNQSLIFFSSQYAFIVGEDSVEKLQGFLPSEKFQSAIAVNRKYYGVVYNDAIVLYRLNNNKLEIVDKYEVLDNESQFFTDMIYYEEQNILIALDHYSGVIQLDVDLNNQHPRIQGKKVVLFDLKYCKILNLNNQTKVLHVLCQKVYDLDISKWPKVETMYFHFNPGVRVNQIYSFGSLTAFVGVDAFMVKYWDKKAAYYDHKNLDQLIFTSDYFISVSEESIMIAEYKIKGVSVQCKITDQSMLGDHLLMFESKADCSTEFFHKHNISLEQFNFTDDNVCMYSVQQKVHIWKPGKLMSEVMEIGFIIFWSIVVLVLGVIMWRKILLDRAQRIFLLQSSTLSNKSNKIEDGASAKAMKLNEEIQGNPSHDSNQYLENQEPVKIKNEQKKKEKDSGS